MQQYPIIKIIQEMIALVTVIQEQSNDNPELSNSVLGKSIVNQADHIYRKLKNEEHGRKK